MLLSGIGPSFFLDMKSALYTMISNVVMENAMPIRIRHRDKNTVEVQQADIAWIIIEMRSFLQVSYTDPYKHRYA